MTICRTSAFTFAATVLVGSVPGVAANCWVRSLRNKNCDGLSNTVRIIIGGSVCLACIVLLSLAACLRRRSARTNLVYLQRVPQGRVVVNEGPYGPPSPPPKYPAQTYDGSSPNTAFVLRPASPP